jgi:hypothetical protein
MNDLLDANIEIHEVALGAAPEKSRLLPGLERDIGLSKIGENAPAAGHALPREFGPNLVFPRTSPG